MAKKATAGRKKSTKKVKGNSVYIELKEKLGEASAEPYRMSQSYSVNTPIEHPKFGVGFVCATTPDKIEVAFPDMNRSFVQNRK